MIQRFVNLCGAVIRDVVIDLPDGGSQVSFAIDGFYGPDEMLSIYG